MSDSELLDRRIEQLVVSTVQRELRRRDEQEKRIADKVSEHTSDAVAYAMPGRDMTFGGRPVPWDVSKANDEVLEAVTAKARLGEETEGLTVAVLLESLRRAKNSAGDYARECQSLRNENVTLKSRLETQSNTLQRKVAQLAEAHNTCTRIIQERDAAQRHDRETTDLNHSLGRQIHSLTDQLDKARFELREGGQKFIAVVDEREKFRAWWEDRRDSCKQLEAANTELARMLETQSRELEALRTAYNELAKVTA